LAILLQALPATQRRRTTRAGEPTTTVFAGTSFVTTEPAPTTALSPMLTPGSTVTFAPSQIVWPKYVLKKGSV
jgi:hypothetical protein